MSRKFHSVLGASALLVMTGTLCMPVAAQTPASPGATTTPQPLAPKPCSDPTTEGRRSGPYGQSTQGKSSSGETLSEKLDSSNGVLCPPSEIDPGISVKPPNVGNTPVIPPPGSPGGDPTVRPK